MPACSLLPAWALDFPCCLVGPFMLDFSLLMMVVRFVCLCSPASPLLIYDIN